ncbi:hypothetical protein F8S13_19375 [Chloroflexia bacterium SDU3-3]|nr:hypothetical protein F8S13_19375 [Chloroflexia bacterium SDU3-3]
MQQITSISALDAFLGGISFGVSMYTRNIKFDFSIREIPRHRSPSKTLLHTSMHLTRPSIATLSTEDQNRQPETWEAFGKRLESWFTRHEQFLPVAPYDSADDEVPKQGWLRATDQILIAASEAIEAIISLFGEQAEVYIHPFPAEIYHRHKMAVFEEDRVLIFGRKHAALLILRLEQA